MTTFEIGVLSLLALIAFVALLIYGRLNRIHTDFKQSVLWASEDRRDMINLLTDALLRAEETE